MNKNVNKNLVCYLIMALVMLLSCYTLCHIDNNKQKCNEHCELNHISIGMDSLSAVNVLKEKWYKTCQVTECYIPFKIKGDSIGYTYYKDNESFFIKIKNSKVYDISFSTNSKNKLNYLIADSMIVVKNDEPFKYIGKHIIIEYNGKNTYHLYEK